MYIARYLGAVEFGILSFALAFTRIFGILINLGLDALTIREVARNKLLAGKYFENVTAMKILLGFVTFGSIILFVNVLGYPERTGKIIYIIALSVIFAAFSNMLNSIFQAYEQMEYVSIGQILNTVLMFFGVLFAINRNFNIIGFASIYLLASFIVLVYSFIVLKWRIFNRYKAKYSLKIDLDFCKSTIKKALPFGLTGIFITVYYYIDTIMLSKMVANSSEVMGWYNAAYKLIFILISIPSLYIRAIFPVMSRYFKSSGESLKFLFERSIRYVLVISIPILVGTTLLADKIVLLTFGKGYMPSVKTLQILIWSFLFASIGGVFGYLLNSTDRQATLTKIVGFGMVLNIIMNLLLIPNFSYIGASIATDLTRLFVISVEFVILGKIGFKFQGSFLVGLFKIIASSAVMASYILFFNNINLFLLIFISALIYFIVFYILRGFDEDDISIVKRLLHVGTES